MGEIIEKIIAIHVSYPNAKYVPRVESKISNLANIVSQQYLRAPNKNGRWVVRSASYIVISEDPRRLKITLTQLDNNGNFLISF